LITRINEFLKQIPMNISVILFLVFFNFSGAEHFHKFRSFMLLMQTALNILPVFDL